MHAAIPVWRLATPAFGALSDADSRQSPNGHGPPTLPDITDEAGQDGSAIIEDRSVWGRRE